MEDKKRVRQTKNAVMAVLILAAVVIVAYLGFYTVDEQQQAVVTQFGKAVDVTGAGVHFLMPVVQQAHKVQMTIQGMEFGYNDNDSLESESLMITKDFNFVNVDFYVEWKVSDPIKYVYASEDPSGLLRNILQAGARNIVSSYMVDEVLTTAKSEIETRIQDDVTVKLNEYDIGVTVVNISLQDATPPTEEVIQAFKDVENAMQNKQTQINEANAYFNEVQPAARAEADKVVKAAEAEKEARINDATGQTARFNEMFEEYASNQEITRTRMYLEAMEDILPGVKLYIDGGGDTLKFLDLNQGGSSRNNESANDQTNNQTNNQIRTEGQ